MIKLFISILLLSFSSALLAQSQHLLASTNEANTLVIGIFPRRDPALTVHLFKPLINYLEQQTGYKFILETSPDFESFGQSLQQRRYDLVHFNQYHYVKSHDSLHYDVLVQNEEFGEKTIRGGIYVRKDSGIDSLQQLRGKSILFGGGKEAMMSYIVPRYLLAKAGLKPADFQELYALNPPNSILATYTRQVVASGAGDMAIRLPIVTSKIDTSSLKALALSEEMAHLPWAVKRELPEALKAKLKDYLLNLKNTQPGLKILQAAKLSALNPATDSDYNLHREVISAVEAQARPESSH